MTLLKVKKNDEGFTIPERYIPSPGDKINEFCCVKQLGDGTYGIVVLVTDPTTTGRYAMKVLKLWAIPYLKDRLLVKKRFNLEYETGLISSKYLVHTFSTGEIMGNPYLVMEYCSNGDLRKKIKSVLSIEQINSIAIAILKGLADLHLNGKIHRDLKPDNILFDHNDSPKLCDFGIAGHKGLNLTERNILGRPREIFGTYAYIAPEQVKPKFSTKLPSSDIFSFGVMMFEVFTGILPFGPIKTDSDLASYTERSFAGNWINIRQIKPDIPDYWVHILERSLQPNYGKRFQSVHEILELLPSADKEITVIERQRHSAPLSLQIMFGDEPGRIIPIDEMSELHNECILTIGRRDERVRNDIEIKEGMTCYISRNHATLEKHANPLRWYMRDGQWREFQGKYSWIRSKNGTFINSREVDEKGSEIFVHDIITIGETTLKVILKNRNYDK